MSSSLSHSLGSTRAVTGLDNSLFSPIQIDNLQYYYNQSSESASHSSDYDEDIGYSDEVETSDEQVPISALYEANDALMNVLKAHIELMASTHRYINRKKKNDYKNSQKHVINDNNNHHSKQGFIIDNQTQHHDTKFIKRTRSIPNVNSSPERNTYELYEEINTIIDKTKFPISIMEKFVRQNPLLSPPSYSSSTSNPSEMGVTNLISTPLSPPSITSPTTSYSPPPLPRDLTSPRLSETAEVTVYPSSVSLKGLLSYQDVMNAIEREFHLHEGQEREIIMKLWLKGQTMISILQRYRHLLQDLNLDDQDFLNGMKQIREMINYADRDVHHLREQTIMLENQNRFLESEFHRQLDKIIMEKNEQISRLIHIIDQTCAPPAEYTDHIRDITHATGNHDLLAQKFMQENVALQRELETLRARLEYTFTLLNEKLDQYNGSSPSSVIQTAIDQMRHSDAKLQELQLKSSFQQEENDLLRYIMDRSQHSSNPDVTQLFSIIEQRSLERELHRVRHELEITENKIVGLEQKFEHSDETVKFNIERLKLKCDVLRQHILTCNRRLNEAMKQLPDEFMDDNEISKHEKNFEIRGNNTIQLENELSLLREQYNELLQYSNTIKFELDNARKQLHEQNTLDSSIIPNDSSELEHERRRSTQLEKDLISLKIKYEDVCERVTAATLQLERVQVVLEQTLRRCEQLEKEKLEINGKSDHLSQNVASVTAKYKDKMNSIKSRLEQTDRERREAQYRTEQLQHEIERLKNELTHKKEVIYEKDKLIQDTQYKSREMFLERQSAEEKISNEYKRLNELEDRNRLLEEELERIRRSQILENITVRRTDVINLDGGTIDSSNRIEELRMKINEYERKFLHEKTSKESLQVQMKILEEENTDLRDIMSQMRKRTQDDRREDRDRNDEIQLLIARAESNARQYMSNFNLSPSPTSTLVRIMPLS
ncbi:unnamed protein product [Adineta steineri]|uniref:Uncharacterized protein n=1 Tax=Adineta steineri TaxID=433720 RepID=A0A818SK85_9BILA|nr:unnamed protein product [Adineta steineri]